MSLYYRLQPAGLDLAGHCSETSNGEAADGLHVFTEPSHCFCPPDGLRHSRARAYGTEVVEIEAARDWPNRDVEGVCVDPNAATIVRRWTLAEFDRTYLSGELGRDANWEYYVRECGDEVAP